MPSLFAHVVEYQNTLVDWSYEALCSLCVYAQATVTLADGRILVVNNGRYHTHGESLHIVDRSSLGEEAVDGTDTAALEEGVGLTPEQWGCLRDQVMSIELCSRVKNLARIHDNDMRYLEHGEYDQRVFARIIGIYKNNNVYLLPEPPWVNWRALVRHLVLKDFVQTQDDAITWVHGFPNEIAQPIRICDLSTTATTAHPSPLDVQTCHVKSRLLEMVAV